MDSQTFYVFFSASCITSMAICMIRLNASPNLMFSISLQQIRNMQPKVRPSACWHWKQEGRLLRAKNVEVWAISLSKALLWISSAYSGVFFCGRQQRKIKLQSADTIAPSQVERPEVLNILVFGMVTDQGHHFNFFESIPGIYGLIKKEYIF